MVMAQVAFYFDFGSPNAYLSHKVIPGIESRTGATFEYVPVLLGGLFKLTGNRSPAEAFASIKNKLAYEGLETRRFVARHGLTTFRSNPYFPVNTLKIMRGGVAAQRQGVFDAYVDAVFHHMWEAPKKMDDPEVIVAALTESGLDAARLMAGTEEPEVKQALLDNTTKAFEAGAFGSPTFVVDGEIWFGKDRLRDVEEAIVAAL
jgi:2-hydroxychromene-2-carboxylate isomerase